ncbi:MAG: hypothetical protein ACOC16_02685 [Nanoarchaeota archaeon]
MRKKIIFLSILLCLMSVNAFDVLDENGKERSYFSLNNDHVFVESESNLTYLNVSYTILGQNKSKSYSFQECENKYCLDFELSDLIESDNVTFVSSKLFNLKTSNEEKNIYFDISAPVLNIKNISLNKSSKKIIFKYNYTDDLSDIFDLKLYEKEGSSLNFIDNIENNSTYSYKVNRSGNYLFVFKIQDIAGNENTYEKSFEVEDLFKPIIDNVKIIKDNNYKISFVLEDNNLSKYEFIQNDIKLSEDINGKKYSKTVEVPFNTGDIILRVIDKVGNQNNITLNLNKKISITYNDYYSNKDIFKIKSSADNCYLNKLDSKDKKNQKFKKSSNEFSIDLDISSIREYRVDFYCDEDNYREYFKRFFFYDINPPEKSELKSTVLDNGNLKLEWTKSFDEETSDIEYLLYRDGKKIYDGSKLLFEDNKVSYPNEYEYYVDVRDEAGNTKRSNKVELIPKKVSINYLTSLKQNEVVQDENYTFHIETEEKVNVSVIVKHENKIIDNQNFDNIKNSKLDLNVKLNEGINQINIKIKDKFNNTIDKTYFATLKGEEILTNIQDSQSENKESKIKQDTIKEPINQTQKEGVTKENNSNNYNWIWFLIILIIFIYFIWFFIINEPRLREKFSKNNNFKKRNIENKRNQNKLFNFNLDKNVRDKHLEKDFHKIKQRRIKNDEERQRKLENEKKLKEKTKTRSELEKQKLKDLSRKKELNIPITSRKKNKRNIQKIKKESDYQKELESQKNKEDKINNKKMLGFFKKKKKETQSKKDEMSSYIDKIKKTPSWSNTRDYIQKETPKQEDEKSNNLNEKQNEKLKSSNKDSKINEKRENEKKEDLENKKLIERRKQEEEKKAKKLHLDDYLNKALKKKRKNYYMAERFVESDLKKRKD